MNTFLGGHPASRQGIMAVITVILLITLFPIGLLAAPASVQKPLKDIKYTWARDAIEALVSEGVINGYPDRTFRPEANVTRAEFAKIVARAFAIRPSGTPRFKDIETNWAKAYITALNEKGIVNGYPDGTFRPGKNISRAELVAMLSRVIRLGDKSETVVGAQTWEPTFRDVNREHWAFRYAETAKRLGMIPAHFGALFEPEKEGTRAETAFMVKALTDLKTVEGKIASVNPSHEEISMEDGSGTARPVQVGPETLVFRNNITTGVGNLKRGDKIYVVSSAYGEPRFVKAEGPANREEVLGKVSALTKGLLTPEQLEALSKGNWESVRGGLQPELLKRLLGYGLTESEAIAMLTQDWTKLGDLAKDRLVLAISQELNISTELATAILNKDWDKAKSYGQIEVAQYLLGRLLNL